MKILVACEESQRVTTELRKLGHEAYSCDIIECSGNHPEWHIKQDVLPLIDGDCEFETTDEQIHNIIGEWDMIIAFPPCTYLSVVANRHYSLKYNSVEKVEARKKEREKAIEFFMQFVNAKCKRIAIENPVGIMNSIYRKPDQIIHPYFFGDNFQKRTCLWLKGLPKLQPTNMLEKPKPLFFSKGDKTKGKPINWVEGIAGLSKEERQRARSKTFPGIAKAMAQQWTVQ